MILRWLRKMSMSTKDPDRILVYCALYGACDIFGVFGAAMIFWNTIKKRKRDANGNKKNSSMPVR